MSRKINLDYIVNMSDEEISSLNREQIRRRLKIANDLAIERRNEMVDYLKSNPQVPTPLMYKQYHRTVKPKQGHIDWLTYDFDFENHETLNNLRHKLITVRQFLSSKTSSVSGWISTLKETAKTLGKELGTSVSISDISNVKYKRLWRVYNKLAERHSAVGTAYEDSKQLVTLIYRTMQQKKYRGYGVERLTNYLEEFLTNEYEDEDDIDEEIEFSDIFNGLGRQR